MSGPGFKPVDDLGATEVARFKNPSPETCRQVADLLRRLRTLERDMGISRFVLLGSLVLLSAYLAASVLRGGATAHVGLAVWAVLSAGCAWLHRRFRRAADRVLDELARMAEEDGR